MRGRMMRVVRLGWLVGTLAGCANPLAVTVVREADGLPIPHATVGRMKTEVGFPYFMGPVRLEQVEAGRTDARGDVVLRDRRGAHLYVTAEGYFPRSVSLGELEPGQPAVTVPLRSSAEQRTPRSRD